MKRIEISGSHYEMGLQLGEILKRERGYPPNYPKDVLAKSHAYEEQVQIYAPGLLEEFHGMADSLGIDYRIPVTLEATPFRFQATSCLVMAISGEHTKDGMPVLARNHEWMERDSENLRLCYAKPDGKLGSLGFTFHWPLVSRYGGMNNAGLALSSNMATFDAAGPGIMLNLATRWILDTCRTTREAVAYLEAIPKVWGTTYVIIDRENHIAKVEAHREKTKVTYSETGFEFNTLLYDSPEMQQFMSQERIDSCIDYTSARKAFLAEWFARTKGHITADLIIDALKSHEHKMCFHGLEGLEICWSYVLNNRESKALVCAGRPCHNEFVPVDGPQGDP
jgi:predicted choloylglycine hydrolase